MQVTVDALDLVLLQILLKGDAQKFGLCCESGGYIFRTKRSSSSLPTVLFLFCGQKTWFLLPCSVLVTCHLSHFTWDSIAELWSILPCGFAVSVGLESWAPPGECSQRTCRLQAAVRTILCRWCLFLSWQPLSVISDFRLFQSLEYFPVINKISGEKNQY